MNSNLFMNCLWYEDIAPYQIAKILEISEETFFDKVFGNKSFTNDEIKKISCLLGLTKEEIEMIFF